MMLCHKQKQLIMHQGYINRGTCSQPELTSGHVLSSAYVIIFWAVATNAVNKSVWRKKTVLDFPSTNMQWIMNNLWDTEHGSLRTRAQCSETQSTVLCDTEHGALRHRARCSETQSTVLWDTEHGALRHRAQCSQTQSTVLSDTEHGALRHRAQCSENQSTVLWDTEHSALRHRAQCSETQSTVLWDTEHTGAPCSPRAPNLLYVLPTRLVGWNDLCSPASYLGEIFERVQFVPFSLLSWLRSVHFVPYQYKMRGKSIWNIWTRIKWEAKLANLKWTPLMGLNQLCSEWVRENSDWYFQVWC